MNTKPGAALSRSQMKSIKGGGPAAGCPTSGQSCSYTTGITTRTGVCVTEGTMCLCQIPNYPIHLLCAVS
jgi:hypothetical protein